MIKAAIFDLDGTLLDRDESVKKFVSNQYDRLLEFLHQIPKETYIKRFIELDCRGYVRKDKVYQQLVQDFNIKGLTWQKLLEDYISMFKHNCVPFPNLITMLGELKETDLQLGMITNGKGKFQLDNIRSLGIENYFDTILVSEWEGIKKPNPQIFMKAVAQLNVQPNQCIFVGDHPNNDVKAARHVGMIGIWKKDFEWNNVDADYIIDDLAELPIIIKRMCNNENF
ncbi:HAD-IA family hydrolase [Fredinandcohnia sp. QZ13]|uniref:HAD family hydrolase n=1 Tax=Fredinandcohnia sp. QZ13 TaxID=3073144 RepID=UPI0028533858|nr:HAD-IA family hydrolase [Fredinandcohnia sp. QZ13]MDR4886139.1 HAD-IA family hydrolase [Fredinandcohnia sp. QZ13]